MNVCGMLSNILIHILDEKIPIAFQNSSLFHRKARAYAFRTEMEKQNKNPDIQHFFVHLPHTHTHTIDRLNGELSHQQ